MSQMQMLLQVLGTGAAAGIFQQAGAIVLRRMDRRQGDAAAQKAEAEASRAEAEATQLVAQTLLGSLVEPLKHELSAVRVEAAAAREEAAGAHREAAGARTEVVAMHQLAHLHAPWDAEAIAAIEAAGGHIGPPPPLWPSPGPHLDQQA